uniref:Uncharacterized protein n=1 Tax=Trichobilharzia regenti TaxID=157069 RepID=A0AA85JQQ7_TRIRE|nr:unnamed protein product [Trichobilharzia regenti]
MLISIISLKTFGADCRLELLILISLRFYKYNFLQMSTSHSAPKYYRTILSNLDYSSFDLFCNRIKLTKKQCNLHNHRVSTLRCLQQNAGSLYTAIGHLIS